MRDFGRRWGWGIAIIGVAVLTSGTQRRSPLEIAMGALLLVSGACLWVGKKLHRLGWVVVASGAGVVFVGLFGGTLIGIPVAPRSIPLLVIGPLLVICGGVLRAVLLARARHTIVAPTDPREGLDPPH